jgi:hypothetical protein
VIARRLQSCDAVIGLYIGVYSQFFLHQQEEKRMSKENNQPEAKNGATQDAVQSIPLDFER